VVNVADSANIDVRFSSLELLLCHLNHLLKNLFFIKFAFVS